MAPGESLGCGGGNCTRDLQVMGLASCYCSTPRQKRKRSVIASRLLYSIGVDSSTLDCILTAARTGHSPLVGEEGVEPSWIAPYDFESYVYTSSTTRPATGNDDSASERAVRFAGRRRVKIIRNVINSRRKPLNCQPVAFPV